MRQNLSSNINNLDYIRMFNSSSTIAEIYESMPDLSFKILNIQQSPDNPYDGNICYCHIYKINTGWGTAIICDHSYDNKKYKKLFDGQWSNWTDIINH